MEYRTLSMYIAAALVAVGVPLRRVERESTGNVVFVFPDDDGETRRLAGDYRHFQMPPVQPNALFTALISVRERMYAAKQGY